MTEFDLHIRPGLSRQNYWKDIWRYREPFYFPTWRDILVRYYNPFTTGIPFVSTA
jgi:hypothetical protein